MVVSIYLIDTKRFSRHDGHMNSQATSNQSGFAMIAVAVVAVVLLGAVAGYFVIRDQTGESNPIEAIKKSTSQATANCDYNDKNICRFLDASTEKRSHTVTISGTDQSGQESISTIKTDVNDNSYVEVSSGGESFVTMSIGSTTYTKDEDGTWWKLEGSQDSMDKEKDLKFDIPSATASAEERVEFKKLGKEKCGSLTCFKYSFTEGKDNKSVQYI